ncbi:MAG: SDR family oxidoreductase [Spirochaetota bacterium]
MSRKIVLITGASSGIGLALSQLLYAKDEFLVLATARASSLPRFAQQNLLEKDHFFTWPLDICNAEERENCISQIESRFGSIDILINNAGVSYTSVIEEASFSEELQQLQINYFAAMALIRRILPAMRKKRSGRIINVSSVGGMMAMPTMGIYSASKFALEGATESLWYEMKPWNIKVTLFQPGFVHSDAFRKVLLTEKAKVSSADTHSVYQPYYSNMSRFIAKMMGIAYASPETLAQKLYKLMQAKNPPIRVAATIDALFFAYIRRFLPRKLYHYILYRFLPNIKEWEAHAKTFSKKDSSK